ncbi:MAG: DUF3011 domain-containing protein [Bdellovibrionales bacterium]
MRTVLACISAAFLLAGTSAFAERFQIEYRDAEFSGNSALFLKRELQRQHRINPDDYELRSAVLVAKTRQGRGTASLQVGTWRSRDERVNMGDFNDNSPRSFDRVSFFNDARDSRGAWQMDLNGNFKVRRVAVELVRHGGGGDWGGSFEQIRCDSIGYFQVECRTSGEPRRMRVLQVHSSAPCVLGRTFGMTRNGVWVSRGCRATFEVELR